MKETMKLAVTISVAAFITYLSQDPAVKEYTTLGTSTINIHSDENAKVHFECTKTGLLRKTEDRIHECSR
jgi:hypothetical protein